MAWRKKEKAPVKRKWQLEDDDDDDDNDLENTQEEDEADYACTICKADGALVCTECDNAKFCKSCFVNTHPQPSKRCHKIRAMVGENLNGLKYGWIIGQPKPTFAVGERSNSISAAIWKAKRGASQRDKSKSRSPSCSRSRSRSRSPRQRLSRSRSQSRSRSRSVSRSRSRSRSRSPRKHRSRSSSHSRSRSPAGRRVPSSVPVFGSTKKTPSSVPVFRRNSGSDNSMGDSAKDSSASPSTGVFRTLFVRNLPFDYSSSNLRDFFKRAGRIVSLRMPKGDDGRGRGIAFVEFDNPEAAKKGMMFNNVSIEGRSISVALNQTQSDTQGEIAERPRRKTRMCQHFIRGSCHKGDQCTFAHHPRELEGGGASGTSEQNNPQFQQLGNGWTCPSCQNKNYPYRMQCNKCKAARPGGGRQMQPPSRGIPVHNQPPGRGIPGHNSRPGDWSCPKCANFNFASRLNCNRCQGPKPYVAPKGLRSGAVDGGMVWK